MTYHPEYKRVREWMRHLDLSTMTVKTVAEMYNKSYPTWARTARAWDALIGTGGTYTMRAIMWYQHIYRPGSTDSRPAVIIKAILETMDKTP